jgi:hypothetical protein
MSNTATAPTEAPAKTKRSYDDNLWTGSGNLGGQIKVTETKTGFSVGRFSIGITMMRPNDGVKGTTWGNIVVLDQLAKDLFAKQTSGEIKVGDKLKVKARLNIRNYVKDNATVSFTELIAFEVTKVDFDALRAAKGFNAPANAAPAHQSTDEQLEDEVGF